jgi:hypothetical protein
MNLTAIPRRDLFQAVSVETIILVSEETRCTVVAALDDVLGNARQSETGFTRHGAILPE